MQSRSCAVVKSAVPCNNIVHINVVEPELRMIIAALTTNHLPNKILLQKLGTIQPTTPELETQVMKIIWPKSEQVNCEVAKDASTL